jgi:hypothetical protein
MSSPSALTKHCPQCSAMLAEETTYCACGYRFNTEAQPESNLVAQAEALYETHLRARLQRAVRTARLAKVDLLRDPRSPVKRTQLREMEKEVKALETQVMIQSARVADLRPAVTHPNVEAAPLRAKPISSVESPDTFRAAQTVKADKTFELFRLQQAVEKLRSSQATSAFHALQTEKADEVAKQTSTINACPSCGAAVNAGVVRCGCGYKLIADADAASDFLSAEEKAALRGNP